MNENDVIRILAKARFKFRSDPLATWKANNPILLEGEAGVVTGLNEVGDGLEDKTKKIKFGDGIHDWNSLDWWYGEVDQTYTPTSPNAQSGLATAEAVGVANNYTDKAIKSSKTYANNTFAPAIKNTVSGSVLAVHDVSPVEHDLNIKLSSDTLTDFSSVSVSRYGKNLWTDAKRLVAASFTIVEEGINNITVTANTETGKEILPRIEWIYADYKKLGNNLKLSFDYELSNSVSSDYRCNEVLGQARRKDGSIRTFFVKKLGGDTTSKQHASIDIRIDNEDYEWYRIGFYGSVLSTDSFKDYRAELSNIQLEVGTTATDYEPYIEPQTVTANADGTVEGLTSISPNITVTTDTEGVVIDMTYNADTKMYIDNKLAEISTAIVNNV